MPPAPALSVIIPTHKRAPILLRALEYLDKQSARGKFEVIVVSDGPDERTAELLANTTWSFPLQCFAIPKSQQGAARNAGVKCARGELCLLIGDDIFLTPDACERHIATHATLRDAPPRHGEDVRLSSSKPEQHGGAPQGDKPFAVLGFVTWDPSLEITPTMRWLEKTGWQFGYPKIAPFEGACIPREIQHRFTYTSHISLPTEIARKIPFREDVSLYGWEDIEWGLRLREAGIPLFYEPKAKAMHYHRVTLEESLARMETLGMSVVHLTKLVPELDRLPQGWKRWGYQALSLLPTFRGVHSKAFLQGIRSAGANPASACASRT